MTCRQCGIEIADKALICYRCGTATAEAKFAPAAPRRPSSPPLVSVLIILVLVIGAFLLGRTFADPAFRVYTWVAAAFAVIVVAARAVLRRWR